MAKTISLHVIVSDLHHQLGPERLPRQILALAPAALPSRPAIHFSGRRLCVSPVFPWMDLDAIRAVGFQKFRQFAVAFPY